MNIDLSASADYAARAALCAAMHQLAHAGMNHGATGNCAVRVDKGFLLTPSGMDTHTLTAQDMVWLNDEGSVLSAGKPSSEWRMHVDILRARPDIQAVVHAHSPFATTLACLRREIPPFHYMIALAGGDSIPCAPYALFGSQALSDAVLGVLHNRDACLLANHGMLALGKTLAAAVRLAEEVEFLCAQYWRCLQLGAPTLLSGEEMQAVTVRFRDYGPAAAAHMREDKQQ